MSDSEKEELSNEMDALLLKYPFNKLSIAFGDEKVTIIFENENED